MALTDEQVQVVIALERTGASLSLVGITFIFVAYWMFRRLRTIPNLFILFASIANVGASIACVIGYDGILSGEESALCQAQAFLLEMFMQSDPWWSLAMAVNVFLVFFFGANPASFRRYLWVYCLVCFGGPFLPAISMLVARPNGKPIYGDATLWCWINHDWNALRIYTYYLPIWVCILFSSIIYFAVGYHVFHSRNQLRNLTFSHTRKDGRDVSHLEDARDSTEKHLTPRPGEWQVTAVTEVQITTAAPAHNPATGLQTLPMPPEAATRSQLPHQKARHQPSWRASSDEAESSAAGAAGGSDHARFETMISSDPPQQTPKPPMVERMRFGKTHYSSRLKGLDPIKLAYLRTSFIFAISILVTWTPSSINRVNDVVNPDSVSYGLIVATAVVLPLQGVWNAIIFFTTSWGTFKEEWSSLLVRRSTRRHETGWDGPLSLARTETRRAQNQRDPFDIKLFERSKRPGSDETSELELTPPTNFSTDNVRASMGGS